MHAVLTDDAPYAEEKVLHKIEELHKIFFLSPEILALASALIQYQAKIIRKIYSAGKDGQEFPTRLLKQLRLNSKHKAGEPILHGKNFPLHTTQIKSACNDILAITMTTLPALAGYAAEVEMLMKNDRQFIKNACTEVLGTELDEKAAPMLSSWQTEHPDAPHFLRFIVKSAAIPHLFATGCAIGKRHDTTVIWQHGHCPVCGHPPFMGRLDGKEGRRLHVCSFCAFEYRVPRMGCHVCLTPDPESLKYYTFREEPVYSFCVCNKCKSYIKLADFRNQDKIWLPSLDDLASLNLDFTARDMGYARNTLSAFGF